MSKELLIKGGHVVTVDRDLGDLPAGDVLVADGLIAAVGPDLEPTTTAAEVIEAAGRLVIPGMVDTTVRWHGAIGGYTPDHRRRVRARRADRHLAGHALELMHAARERLRAYPSIISTYAGAASPAAAGSV